MPRADPSGTAKPNVSPSRQRPRVLKLAARRRCGPELIDRAVADVAVQLMHPTASCYQVAQDAAEAGLRELSSTFRLASRGYSGNSTCSAPSALTLSAPGSFCWTCASSARLAFSIRVLHKFAARARWLADN